MDSYPGDFPFGIMDVVELLHLRIRRRQANSVYVDCPFCGDRRGKMNVNFVKNVWRCNYCDEHGGMLALYARLNNTTTSDAYWEIGEALPNRRGIIAGKISLVPYFLGVPPITTPPNRFNVIVQCMCCKFSAYFPNVLHNCIAVSVPIQAPHKLINSLAVKNLSCIEG